MHRSAIPRSTPFLVFPRKEGRHINPVHSTESSGEVDELSDKTCTDPEKKKFTENLLCSRDDLLHASDTCGLKLKKCNFCGRQD